MPSSFRPTRLVVVLLACTLSLPLPAAAQARESIAVSPRAVLTWLANLWGFSLKLDNGCKMDPDGQCLAQTSNLDNGCKMDPSGQCLPQASPNNGCQMDPDGSFLSSSCLASR